MKRVAIIQSNYIPWKGYFDIINWSDECILYDDAQYTRGDWRNRNKIKTPQSLSWLTIPIRVKGRRLQKIHEAEVQDHIWPSKHWKMIEQNYAKAGHFAEISAYLSDLYARCEKEKYLSRINFYFIERICNILDIRTRISWSMDYRLEGENPTDKLISLCCQSGATEYLSGPSAHGYLEKWKFPERNISVRWINYDGYPEYKQLFPPFVHEISIIDLLMNEGSAGAKKRMLSFDC